MAIRWARSTFTGREQRTNTRHYPHKRHLGLTGGGGLTAGACPAVRRMDKGVSNWPTPSSLIDRAEADSRDAKSEGILAVRLILWEA